MSVLIVTSLGDIVVDLHTDRCPLTCKNFLKLCKIKYYNGCLFHNVQKDFTAQTGDPTGTGSGGDSIYKYLYGDQARFFGDEIHLDLKHSKTGTVAMASAGQNLNASQFYMTLRDDLDYLDEKHTIFGEVAEGLETLSRINEAYVDEKGRPYKNIRIKHTYILEDPFDDPPQLAELVPDASPEGKPKDEVDDEVRLEDDWVPMDEQLAPGELEEVIRTKEAHSRAVVLESIGDIPDAEIKPPENVLFVCKLNPVTEDEDLHTIFSRFGTVTSADIIRDFKTGDSLCYAFIEFEDTDACNQAYNKMDNALIDDRRIHVDFSQSVAKLWSQYRRKDQQNGNKKGCFKCGAPDHFAKDCTGSPTAKHQPAKYILKDDNTQRGSDSKSRYEMVFDGESGGSPQRKKAHGKSEVWDLNGKSDLNNQSLDERKSRDTRDRDLQDRHRHIDRITEQREKERDGGRIHSRSGRDQGHIRREGREFRNESGSIYRDGKVRDEYKKRSLESDSLRDERHEREYSRRSTNEGSHRDERESKNRSIDKSNSRDRRDDRHYEKGSAENNLRGDTRDEREYKRSVEKDHGGRRDDKEYRKRNPEIGYHGNRGDERDYKRRSTDNDVRANQTDEGSERKGKVYDGKRDKRDESYGRKTQHNSDSHRSSREERDYEKRTSK
ncbi:Peptidyl-prolyl cis-trans isomerase [Heracleum sosnowskyi]|uniref:Peptidyl-prolyl cis-trans isomerase n=1 Tax=Heracleum sosnowskyi TaxID=360622 RepID=A0AAD8IP32_9APIA|nr:Peptidyl-prolyl cis-trans isomerase [Heracleum sosnowskyi]